MRFRRHRFDTRPLTSVGLDAPLARQHLEALAAHTDVVRVRAGATLSRAGHTVRQLVAVVAGEVDVRDRSGCRRLAGPGSRFGARELIESRPSQSTLVTRTDCELIVVFGPAYRAAMRSAGSPSDRQQRAGRGAQ